MCYKTHFLTAVVFDLIIDLWSFSEALGAAFLFFAALEAGLKIDDFQCE